MVNLHAYTEPVEQYPAFISINRDDQGAFSVTVRSRGNGGRDIAKIEMTQEQLAVLAADVLAAVM